jgi:hypothetical protein
MNDREELALLLPVRLLRRIWHHEPPLCSLSVGGNLLQSQRVSPCLACLAFSAFIGFMRDAFVVVVLVGMVMSLANKE